MLPNFYHHVSFSRRQFSLARILLSARLFFGPPFFFLARLLSCRKEMVPKTKSRAKKKVVPKKKSREKET